MIEQNKTAAGAPIFSHFRNFHSRYSWIADLGILAASALFLFGIVTFLREGNSPFSEEFKISTSIHSLPSYAMLSLIRSLLALVLSMAFAIAYGTVAAKNQKFERLMVPMLDVLQSLPVLTFLPGIVITLISVFPHSRWGLEASCILLIFTGQVWNLVFAYYESQKTVSTELVELTKIIRVKGIRKFFLLDLPNGLPALIYNGMMSMAGGWFFLTLCESFVLGTMSYKLPGLGSYLQESYLQGNNTSFIAGLSTLAVLVVGVDFILWKPLIAWVARYSETEPELNKENQVQGIFVGKLQKSFLLSKVFPLAARLFKMQFRAGTSAVKNFSKLHTATATQNTKAAHAEPKRSNVNQLIISPLGKIFRTRSSLLIANLELNKLQTSFRKWKERLTGFTRFLTSFGLGIFAFYTFPKLPEAGRILGIVSSTEWASLMHSLFLTLGKVISVLVIATLWTLPAALWISKRRELAKTIQPIIQNLAAFPAPVLFPLFAFQFASLQIPAGVFSTFLMVLGNQWYLLFNLLSGASRINQDLVAVSQVYKFNRLKHFAFVSLPSVFPSLVTGWITTAGGAWNTSIVAELVQFPGGTLVAEGIGAEITRATAAGNYPKLFAAVALIVVTLVLVNRIVWRPLHELVAMVR